MRELRSMLLASSILASGLAASPASAEAIVPSPADFQLIETRLDATTGQYTLINNSSGWYIHEFFVTNPQAGTSGVEPFTTQSNWDASVDNCFGSLSCFTYSNSAGLSSDIAPNTSSDQFFWSSPNPILASDFQLGVHTGDGDPGVVTGTAQDLADPIPEPTSWSILIAGLALLGLVQRRHRLGSA